VTFSFSHLLCQGKLPQIRHIVCDKLSDLLFSVRSCRLISEFSNVHKIHCCILNDKLFSAYPVSTERDVSVIETIRI